MTHLDLLHRARAALLWPDGLLDKEALLRDLDEAIKRAYPKRHHLVDCWCGVTKTDGRCNEHSEFVVGDG